MDQPRLIALDLDGTLLDAELRISERAKRVLQRAVAAGTDVILCTGRPPRMTHAYADELELERSIVFNGASFVDQRDRTCVHHHVLSAEEAGAVVQRLREGVPDVGIGLETTNGWFLDEAIYENRRIRFESQGLPLPDGIGAIEQFLGGGAIKVFARHPERSVAELAAAIEGVAGYATWSGKYLLEVMHPAVNKRNALERLCLELGLRREDVAAFGDNHNDVQMIEWAGHGVAMANASPGAKAAAGEVAASHTEDGVAQILERWFG